MNSQVTVVVTPEGHVIRTSPNNPEYGAVRVEQDLIEYNDRGFAESKKRVAFINGKVELLQTLNFTAGQVLPGRIVVQETLTQPNAEDGTYGAKRAFKDGPYCRLDDQVIYRSTFYSEDPSIRDSFIKHTNSAEIRIAMRERRSVEAPTL